MCDYNVILVMTIFKVVSFRKLGSRSTIRVDLKATDHRLIDWLSSVLRPRQHSTCIGYMGDFFYRSKDPTNSIKVLKEHIIHR